MYQHNSLVRRSVAFAAKHYVLSAIACTLLATPRVCQAVELVGWDAHPLTGGNGNFGASPFAATTTAPNATTGGLIRGSGVLTPAGSSAAARAWGGTDWTSTTQAAAITANDYFSFTLKANTGFSLSITSLDPFSYRRSGTGASSGELQYSLDGTLFTDAAAFSYTSSASGGATLTATDLSAITALQNVPSTTTVTFRIVNWGGTNTAGAWYIFDVANTIADDFAINGTITAVPEPATVAAGLMALGALGWSQRRRLGAATRSAHRRQPVPAVA